MDIHINWFSQSCVNDELKILKSYNKHVVKYGEVTQRSTWETCFIPKKK